MYHTRSRSLGPVVGTPAHERDSAWPCRKPQMILYATARRTPAQSVQVWVVVLIIVGLGLIVLEHVKGVTDCLGEVFTRGFGLIRIIEDRFRLGNIIENAVEFVLY